MEVSNVNEISQRFIFQLFRYGYCLKKKSLRIHQFHSNHIAVSNTRLKWQKCYTEIKWLKTLYFFFNNFFILVRYICDKKYKFWYHYSFFVIFLYFRNYKILKNWKIRQRHKNLPIPLKFHILLSLILYYPQIENF